MEVRLTTQRPGVRLSLGAAINSLYFTNDTFFFFSSRRRHTRFDCDWSSDVFSSDLMIRHTRFDCDWSSDVCSSDLVKFHGDTAEAEVKFESKESPDLAVKVHYVLQKSGDHWVVRSSSPAGGMGGPHSSAARESQTRPQEGGSTAGEPEPQSCH